MKSYKLEVLALDLSICRLAADTPPNTAWFEGSFGAVIRTPVETCVVTERERAPDGPTRSDGWRALRVAGPLDLTQTGILAALSQVLADAGVPLFAVSTYDTDYLLVPGHRLGDAVTALGQSGHRIPCGAVQRASSAVR